MSCDLIGYGLAVIGFIFSYIFYVKARKEKIPVYLSKKTSIIGTEHSIFGEDVKIYFKDKPVNKLSLCNITIRNIGGETIRRQDFAVVDPPQIFFNEQVNIMSCSVKRVTRPPVKFEICSFEGNQVNFAFEFLDRNDGALVEIVHDGPASITPKIKGTIVGAPSGFTEAIEGSVSVNKRDIFAPLFQIAAIVLLGIFLNFQMTKMQTDFYPISPVLADSPAGKKLIERVSHGDRQALSEIRKLSGLEPSKADWVEHSIQGMLVLMVFSSLYVFISRLRTKKISDLMFD